MKIKSHGFCIFNYLSNWGEDEHNITLFMLDRERARFIYVEEIKKCDPFEFRIYAWCMKIAIADNLVPVRLAWAPF